MFSVCCLFICCVNVNFLGWTLPRVDANLQDIKAREIKPPPGLEMVNPKASLVEQLSDVEKVNGKQECI